MGCSSSVCTPAVTGNVVVPATLSLQPGEDKANPSFFSNYTKQIIKRTWKQMSVDMTENGLKIVMRIFKMCPPITELFMVNGLTSDDIVLHPVMRGHGNRFMHAIGAAVDNIDNLNDALASLLFNLGKEHKRFKGLLPQYFDVFNESMNSQWREILGVNYTPEVADAWCRFFVFMMEKLKEGYYSTDFESCKNV